MVLGHVSGDGGKRRRAEIQRMLVFIAYAPHKVRYVAQMTRYVI